MQSNKSLRTQMKQYNYIYKITNQINNKIYIGKHSTDNLDDGYMGSGILIKKAIQKYGIENFTKEYLAFCNSEEKLNLFERFYIKKFNSREVGYNLTDGGDGSLGRYCTKETRTKIGEAHKGKHHTEEVKQKIGEAKKGEKNPNYGKHFSEETRQKIRNTLKGKSKPKFKWLTTNGEIVIMDIANVKKHHPDWNLI